MKKVLLFITMAAALLFTQCKKEVSVPSAGKTVSMTVTAGPGSKTDITDAGAITWSTGDKLYVGDGTQYIGYLTLEGEGGSATGVFTGNVTLPTDTKDGEKSFGFFYLGSGELTLEDDATSVDVDFSSQDITKGTDGKLTNASKQHVGYGKANGTVTEDGMVTDINVMLVSKVALAHFDIKKGEDPYGATLTLSGDNICNKMTVKFDGTGFSYEGTKGNISLDGGNGDYYVMLVPTNSTTTSQTLTFADANVSGTATLADGIMPNKFYGKDEAIPVTLEAAGPTHEYVDLGLSVKWATCNLGADSPEKYGDYYQWGGVESVTSIDINVGWDGCPYTNDTYSTENKDVFTKYVPTEKTEYWAGSGDPDNKLVLDPEDDAARANWGGSWRMPTEAEFTELINNTTRTWYAQDNTEFNGVAGYKCVSNKEGYTDKYIFLPAVGSRTGTSLSGAGVIGDYWSSSLSTNSTSNTYCGLGLSIHSLFFTVGGYSRYTGFAVRPVFSPQN